MAISVLQAGIILENLQRIQTEAVASIVGDTAANTAMTTPDAGSLAASVNTLKTSYDADGAAFVASQANIDALQAARESYEGLSFDPIDDISDATDALAESATPE